MQTIFAAAAAVFNRIVIIESLGDNEARTGKILSEFIKGQLDTCGCPIPIEYLRCENSLEFNEIFVSLLSIADRDGDICLLHVECHGDPVRGLEFANGSELSWNELSFKLQQLNMATKFNLLAVFSACYGGHFLERFLPVGPAPCWAMVAPTDVVDPGEIMNGFRVFYASLLSQFDVGKAASAIETQTLSQGRWLGQHAELWFEKVTLEYIENHCTKEAIRKRSKTIRRKLLTGGKRVSFGKLKRGLRSPNRNRLVGELFDRYFMISSIPENAVRFEAARLRLEAKVVRLKNSGLYVI